MASGNGKSSPFSASPGGGSGVSGGHDFTKDPTGNQGAAGGHDFLKDPQSNAPKGGGRDFSKESRVQKPVKQVGQGTLSSQNADSIPDGGALPTANMDPPAHTLKGKDDRADLLGTRGATPKQVPFKGMKKTT